MDAEPRHVKRATIGRPRPRVRETNNATSVGRELERRGGRRIYAAYVFRVGTPF